MFSLCFQATVAWSSWSSRMLQLCQITESLFISNSRSACSDDLIQQGAVTLCINVSKQQPFPTAAAVRKLHVPVYDDPNEDLYSHFDLCADTIQEEVNRGGRAVVYCKNGRSRSAAICIAYLMKHHKLRLCHALQVSDTSARRVTALTARLVSRLTVLWRN